MHPLAEIQELEDGDPRLTAEEKRRIHAFKIPGDYDGSQNFGHRYFPRRPTENVKKWRDDHSAKLASLIRAAK